MKIARGNFNNSYRGIRAEAKLTANVNTRADIVEHDFQVHINRNFLYC